MHVTQENVEIYECRGKIFYMTTKDVFPGEELLVYYGDKYAEYLGFDLDAYYIGDGWIKEYGQYKNDDSHLGSQFSLLTFL